jgi:hypothetical protein
MPHAVLSDGGTEFCNQVLDEVFEEMGIKHLHTTPYHAVCNAQVERNHQTAQRISKYISDDHNDWTEILPFATFAYNTAVHDVIEWSPVFMLLHREAAQPVDITMPTIRLPPLVEEFKRIEDLQVATRAQIEDQQDYSVNYYQDLRREVTYSAGDLLLLCNPSMLEGHVRKFTHPFRGPYCVIVGTSPVNYLVQATCGSHRRGVAHISRMKFFHDRAELLNSSSTELESDLGENIESDEDEPLVSAKVTYAKACEAHKKVSLPQIIPSIRSAEETLAGTSVPAQPP